MRHGRALFHLPSRCPRSSAKAVTSHPCHPPCDPSPRPLSLAALKQTVAFESELNKHFKTLAAPPASPPETARAVKGVASEVAQAVKEKYTGSGKRQSMDAVTQQVTEITDFRGAPRAGRLAARCDQAVPRCDALSRGGPRMPTARPPGPQA